MTVTNGRMYGDNFRETGGATPTGGPSPVPVGNYTFGFPTNNPLLTQLYGENEVWINARKAKAMGIKNGRYVVLVNQDGVRSNKIKATAIKY